MSDAPEAPRPAFAEVFSQNPPYPQDPKNNSLRDLAKCLWTHNPFYLISLALVLHSTRLWHHDSLDAFNPWPLISIIGGYLLLVSVTGFLLIKLGRVWDDARSIFLVILLLFVELSLLFDGTLIRDVRAGTMLSMMGWMAAVVVSECLLIGLRIRLPWTYRGPYHLLLALMFVYPLAIVSGPGGGEGVVWRIFWFSPCVAVGLLSLLPAIQRGRKDLVANGTPWNWPWYPWVLFGFFTICLSLRAWALTLSFDPVLSQGLADAMQMQGTFGGYFLVPVILALGVLCFEAGLVERRRMLVLVGLIAPVVSLILALPLDGGSVPYLEFRGQFTERFGSPSWVALNLCWMFYAYASARGAKEAVMGLMGTAIAMMVFGRVWPDAMPPLGLPSLPLSVSTAAVMFWGWRRSDSRIFVAGMLGLYLAGRDMATGIGSPLQREAVVWNLFCLGILMSGLLFRDRAAKYWQRVGGVLLAINCTLAAALPETTGWQLQYGASLAYCVLATSLAVLYARLTRLFETWSAAIACMVAASGRLMLDSARLLQTSFHWDGALYFVVGLATFVIAVAISILKSSRTIVPPLQAQPGEIVQPTI